MKRKMEVALAGSMTLALASIVTLAPVASSRVKTGSAGPATTDFALLDQELTVGDKSVQCGATSGNTTTPSLSPFAMHITMTNRADLGGVQGFVRTTYHDGDFVEYAIPANTTVQISLAGGGTPGVDDEIVVTGTGGAVLIGQASIAVSSGGRPLPDLGSFCTTTKA